MCIVIPDVNQLLYEFFFRCNCRFTDLALHDLPYIFYGVHVWRVPRPVQYIYVFSSTNLVTILALWHGAPSYIKIGFSSWGNHSDNCGKRWASRIFLYWSCFRVLWTIWSSHVPLEFLTNHTMIYDGCFTVETIQSGLFSSPCLLLTSCDLSIITWKMDSSEKQTCWNR